MTLIEAIKSTRRFKRPSYAEHLQVGRDRYYFSAEDILADDWEVESKSVEINKEKFMNAWFSGTRQKGTHPLLEHMIKELGLE